MRVPGSIGFTMILACWMWWVRILALYTGWTFSHNFSCKIAMSVWKKRKNKWKRDRGWLIKRNITTNSIHCPRFKSRSVLKETIGGSDSLLITLIAKGSYHSKVGYANLALQTFSGTHREFHNFWQHCKTFNKWV